MPGLWVEIVFWQSRNNQLFAMLKARFKNSGLKVFIIAFAIAVLGIVTHLLKANLGGKIKGVIYENCRR
jgi:branched-subunit amino acid ABC-type transport system permease component